LCGTVLKFRGNRAPAVAPHIFFHSFLIMQDKRLTEQRNPRSSRIDLLSSLEIVDLVNSEDRTVALAVEKEGTAIARAIDLVVESFLAGGRLVYLGAGTSGRLGVLDAAEMPPTFGTHPDMVLGVIAGGGEALESIEVGPNDFVLGIATSGTTPFVHGGLEWARKQGAKTGLLICTYPTPEMTEDHDVVIAPLVGPEVITGSTRMKAGTATKLVLNTISTAAMVRTGKVYGNLMVDLQVTCAKLQDRGERILEEVLGVQRDEASALLDSADGSVKVAIVMGRLGVKGEEAREMLNAADGVVSRVVGDLL
jgi:N-acetylmuramic acid 6-phosphate etherase